MTANITDIRSQAAQGRDRDDPGHPHCARCGGDDMAVMLAIAPLGGPTDEHNYIAKVCEVCAQRVVDLLVNPHLFLTAQTTNPDTMMADLMIDGTGIGRVDAISMLVNAAEMLNTGESEVIAHYP